MRVLIACGGTGGHLFPGLAVAETLAARRHEVKLLVSEKAVDQTALAPWTTNSAGSAITVQALRAVGYSGSRGLMRFCGRFVQALGDCSKLQREFQPAAVLGMGGFTSAPALLAARGSGKLIHESNAVPGKANRWSGKVADHIAVGLADCAKFFGHKPVTVTGTPIRQALRQGKVTDAHERLGVARDRLTVLVMGGSQGAHAINEWMAAALPELKEWRGQTQFVHLSGAADEATVRAAYERNGLDAKVMSFCREMELPYSAADVVITRAGAASLTELAAFGLPALLIPYEHAAGNHQWHNARVFERVGAARLVTQAQQLGPELTALLADAGKRAGMARAAHGLAVPDAAERIANLVEAYAN
ncbi:MAG: UDP-N-acetylglucosamine--N-acetylmuramyl-(pentapeptide) pyrophosphoryl-undecaprenol N-acetylglucosamine transferase [Verrucomicrobiae bacterium]|nr:UDP-N-acetylglucosamine--N-acetylmuramyl-(pentapeptide) pyrophosphoryl-undecaprenol N-acetylglucosamine transferase [Verrucomicrobiae bacterium]